MSGAGKISGATGPGHDRQRPGDAEYQQRLLGRHLRQRRHPATGQRRHDRQHRQERFRNNALLVFNRSDSPTFSGVISGSGCVAQAGGGLLTLLGSNTYTGLTTVSAGSLQIGNGGTSGSLAGNILNNTAVIFNRADTSVYAGSMSGNGALVQQGAGTTVLTGSNTYSGGTSINDGIAANRQRRHDRQHRRQRVR